ncbi:MAG: hypothetical protein ACFCGT_24595 [Sandaracinaceae bacterium]
MRDRELTAGLFEDGYLVDPKGLFSFTVLPWEILSHDALSPSVKLVLARLLRRAWRAGSRAYSGNVRLSTGRLAELTGVGRRTVEEAISAAEKAQLIEVTRAPNRVSTYRSRLAPVSVDGTIYVPDWLLPLPVPRAPAKLVYSAVAHAVSKSGIAYTSSARIADDTGLARSTVVKQLRWLIENDWLDREFERTVSTFALVARPEMGFGLRSDAEVIYRGGWLMHPHRLEGHLAAQAGLPHEDEDDSGDDRSARGHAGDVVRGEAGGLCSHQRQVKPE